MEQNLEKNNDFIYRTENETVFEEFPSQNIYITKFIPKYADKNNPIELSKYTIIEDDEVFLYE